MAAPEMTHKTPGREWVVSASKLIKLNCGDMITTVRKTKHINLMIHSLRCGTMCPKHSEIAKWCLGLPFLVPWWDKKAMTKQKEMQTKRCKIYDWEKKHENTSILSPHDSILSTHREVLSISQALGCPAISSSADNRTNPRRYENPSTSGIPSPKHEL